MSRLTEWFKNPKNQKVAAIGGAAGVAGLAFLAARNNGAAADTEPPEQINDTGTGPASSNGYGPYGGGDTSAGDLYNDLQPELEGIGNQLGDLGDTLEGLPEEIGKNIPGTSKGGKKRPPRPPHPGHHGGKGKPHGHGGKHGPKKNGPKRPPRPPRHGQTRFTDGAGPGGKQPYRNEGRPFVKGPHMPGGKVKPAGRAPVKAAPIKAAAQRVAQAKKSPTVLHKIVKKTRKK